MRDFFSALSPFYRILNDGARWRPRGTMRRLHALILIPAAGIIAASAAALAVTGDEAVARMKSRIYSISSMRGTISIKSPSSTLTGRFRYMAPGKFVIDLSEPSGKKIATNGKRLWVYSKHDNVCGVQDVDTSFSGGIASYVNGYAAMATASGASDTVIRLKGSNRTYKEIVIQVDSTFLPKVIHFRTEDGKGGFTATLSGIVVNEPMAPTLFEFNPPAGTQMVKNPLNLR